MIYVGDFQRLTRQERKAFRTHTPPVCEVSGQISAPSDLQVHHIDPVMNGGTKNLANLMYVSTEAHKRIHSLAIQLAKRGEKTEAEWVISLSQDARELERLARVMEGELVATVYYDEFRWGMQRRLQIVKYLIKRLGECLLAEA